MNCYWEVISWKWIWWIAWDWMNCWQFDWIVFVVENDVKVECDEMGNEMWVVDDEILIWAIEIVKLRIVEFDWIVELCELHVFDGNELVVLNGWLICGKPRKKRWDWKHMLYDEMIN